MRLFTKFFLIIGAFATLASACRSNKIKVSDQDFIYELKRGACFGKCPVFEVKVRKDGYVLLNAKMYNENNGKFEKTLGKSQMKEISDAFKKANLFALNEENPTMVADLPMTMLTDNSTGLKKNVKANEKMPAAFEYAVAVMERLAKSDGWTMLEKYEDPQPVKEETKNQVIIYDEIIIEPNPGVRLPVWFKDMEAYGVRLITKVANEQNLWLIGYDNKTIEPTLMLNMLRKDKSIKFAEFNKKISSRD